MKQTIKAKEVVAIARAAQGIAIVDVDGTLFQTDRCLHAAEKKKYGRILRRGEFDALLRSKQREILLSGYSKSIDFATPNIPVVNAVESCRRRGYKIAILTGRHLEIEDGTIRLFRKHNVRYDEMHHNPFTIIRASAFKVLTVAELVKGYNKVIVYDNDEKHVSNITELLKHRLTMDQSFIVYKVRKDGTIVQYARG